MRPSGPVRLLVVDDDRQILDLLELSLSLQGFEVTTATSGAEAIRLLQKARVDVVVMDIFMSPLDGFQTVARLETLLGARLPPVIYLSGLNAMQEPPHLPGHRSFLLAKPFRPSQLVRLIQKLMGVE